MILAFPTNTERAMNNKKGEASAERGSVTLSHKKPFGVKQSSAGASPRAPGSSNEKTKQTLGTGVIDVKALTHTNTHRHKR